MYILYVELEHSLLTVYAVSGSPILAFQSPSHECRQQYGSCVITMKSQNEAEIREKVIWEVCLRCNLAFENDGEIHVHIAHVCATCRKTLNGTSLRTIWPASLLKDCSTSL